MINLHAALTLGERIDLSIDGTSYRSVVQDIESPTEVLVSQVTKGTLPLFIPTGQEIQMILFRSDGIHYFPAMMAGVVVDGPLRMLRFTATQAVSRWQRRANYRVPVMLPVRVWYDEIGSDGAPQRAELNCYTEDLSSTGAMLVCPALLVEGAVVSVDVSLDEENTIQTKCEIRRVLPRVEDQPGCRAAVMFTGLSNPLLRYLSRYLMDEQLRRRNS